MYTKIKYGCCDIYDIICNNIINGGLSNNSSNYFNLN